MYRRLLELLKLIKPQKPRLQQTDVSGSASRKPTLISWFGTGKVGQKTELEKTTQSIGSGK